MHERPPSPVDPADEEQGISRPPFVATGVALGATVVWGAPHPFADAAVGQAISSHAPDELRARNQRVDALVDAVQAIAALIPRSPKPRG